MFGKTSSETAEKCDDVFDAVVRHIFVELNFCRDTYGLIQRRDGVVVKIRRGQLFRHLKATEVRGPFPHPGSPAEAGLQRPEDRWSLSQLKVPPAHGLKVTKQL